MDSTLFNGLQQGHVAASQWCVESDVEERGVEWIQHCLMVYDRDTWQRAIGCLDFYHLNNFNSINSLEINFFFYQNS